MIKYILKSRQNKLQNKIDEQLFYEKKDEIQGIYYRMLEDFSKFCEDNDIQFWLEGGTLIGAYFHEMIIPWDDDLDIAMLREDFEKLNNLNPQWDNMVLQNYNNDKGFNSIKFYKIRDKGTYLNDGRYWSSASNEYQGLFIDIFVYDSTSESSYKKSSIKHKLLVNSAILMRMFFEIFHVFPIEKLWRRILKKQNDSTDKKNIRLSIRSTTRDNKHYFFNKKLVFPLSKMKFGENYYAVPRKTKDYLLIQYKRLEKYPGKNKQRPTHLIEYKKY